MSRRSTRLAAKPAVVYVEGVPTAAETKEYGTTVAQRLRHVDTIPYYSVERAQAIQRAFAAVMADNGTAIGSRMIAYYPTLRRAAKEALHRCLRDSTGSPELLKDMLVLRRRFDAFLVGVAVEECYRW